MEKIKILNAFQIKLLMAFLMLLDHLRFINNLMPSELASFITIISRCVAPMFAYFVAEGIRHTSNLKKYCLRLFLFAGITFIGSTIVNSLFSFILGSFPKSNLMDNNVILTFALAALSILLIKRGKEKQTAAGRWLYVLSIVCFIIGFIWCEWGSVILPFIFIEHFFRDKRLIRILGYVLIEGIAIILPYGEPLYFLVFPFILLYNGERGPGTYFSKYFFYIFYPVHLWIIAIINFLITVSYIH